VTAPRADLVAPSRDRLPPLLAAVLHRMDAWGVALIVALVALLLHDAVTPRALFLAAGIGSLYALGYAVNDYFDAADDARDPRKAAVNVFVHHPLSRRQARALFIGACLLCGAPFAVYGRAGIELLAIGVLVLWAYSAPPLRLKRRPGLDVLTHALFVQTFAYLMCMELTAARWTSADVVVLLVNFFASLSGQLAQQLRDFEVDAQSAATFATTVGRRAGTRCLRATTAILVGVVTGGFAASLIPWQFAPLALAFTPAAWHRLGTALPQPQLLPALFTAAALAYTGVLLVLQTIP